MHAQAKSGWIAALLLAPLPAVTLAAGDTIEGTPVDRRLDASGATLVAITNVAGRIDVVGSNGTEVRVTGRLGSGVERLDLLRDGNRIVVKVILPPKGSMSKSGAAHLRVEMPRSQGVEVSAVSADLRVSGVAGSQDLRTVSGDVISGSAGAAVDIKSVSGDVAFNGGNRAGSVKVATVSGDVDLRAISGQLEVSSISGDVDVSGAALQSARVRTTSGEVGLDTAAQRGATLEVDSVSGDIEMRVRGDAGLAIEARSFSGAIETCFGAQGEPTSRSGPGRRLDLKHGDGGVRVRINSVSGEVAICDR